MKTHILLIGNEKIELGMFEEAFLQIKGAVSYSYVPETSHAFEKIQDNKPDIIFVSHTTQPAASLQFLSAVKSEPKLKYIRVFLYATTIAEEINKMARILGASGCIERTSCQATFLRELKAILDPQLLPDYIFLKRLNNSMDTVMHTD
jgi:hypothetical protein